MTYSEWEEKQSFSGVSPEASTAEAAWNAAIEEAKRICLVAITAEQSKREACILIEEELTQLNTGTGDSYQ